MNDNCTVAKTPNFVEVIAGLRHRLANTAAPIGILVELYDDEVDPDLLAASRNSIVKLERILSLLGIIGNRGVGKLIFYPGISVELDLDDLPLSWLPLATIIHNELGCDALLHGATKASLVFARDKLIWRDNGAGFKQNVIDNFGLPQPEGNFGCGLGLLTVALTADRVGAQVCASNDGGAVLICSFK